MKYEVISTGSKGNAVVLRDIILIDCGVSFKALKGVYNKLKLVLLTHIHSDHFNSATVRALARERPTLRFGCCEWLVKPLVDCGVNKLNIDVFTAGFNYIFKGLCDVTPHKLVHDVPNCGYSVHFHNVGGSLFYATDTANLNGIEAKAYDLYLIEANHGKAEIAGKIYNKTKAGEYSYEKRVREYHLSRDAADDWIIKNAGQNSEFVYLHAHVDKGDSDDNDGKNCII
jgi:phosphoribosyl 1,2-cyclic phosphodiesterase